MDKIRSKTYSIIDLVDDDFFVDDLDSHLMDKAEEIGKELAEKNKINYDDYDLDYEINVIVTLSKKEKKENE